MKVLALPSFVYGIIEKLSENGFFAYAVGGCVRDLLMGTVPHDWDIATSALPEQVIRIFEKTVKTGIAYGTVTVFFGGGNAEVTTFRTEGEYADHRRPGNVSFVDNIEKDLARRDFTVNAMAYKNAIVDPFGGIRDLERGIIRAVGESEKRFGEDALRILRAFRFMARLSFSLEEETQAACKKLAPTLRKISVERVLAELCEIFQNAEYEHLKSLYNSKIFDAVLPEALPFDAERAKKCAKSRSMAAKWAHLCGGEVKTALKRLKAPKNLINAAGELAYYEGHPPYDFKGVAAALKYNTFEDLCAFLGDLETREKYVAATDRGEPIKISDLCVDGAYLIKSGIYGREVGEALNRLIRHMRENPADNNTEKVDKLLRSWNYNTRENGKEVDL